MEKVSNNSRTVEVCTVEIDYIHICLTALK